MMVFINNPELMREYENYKGFIGLDKESDLHGYSFVYKKDDYDTWYSFDPNSCNFHIVKDTEESKVISNESIRSDYHRALIQELVEELHISNRLSRGRAPWVRNHRWIEVRRHGFCYLLCLQTLCLDGNKISGDFNKIQFQAFPGYMKGCNYLLRNSKKKELELIVNYPSLNSLKLKMDQEKEIYVKNTEYDIGDISNINDVIKDFIEFIQEVETLTIKAIEKGNFLNEK